MSAIRDHALRYLTQRMTTVGHLRELLLRGAQKRDPESTRAGNLPEVEAVLAELVTQGVLDDDAWARSRVASLRRQGNSPSTIRAKLAAKRVSRSLLDELFAETDPQETLISALRLLRKKRLGPWAPQLDARAALTKLGRAGFPYGIAHRAVSMDLDEARELAGW